MDYIVEAIKEAITIYDVCDIFGIDVLPNGFFLCPHHDDTRPTNCCVFDKGRQYYCHVCGKGGDIFSLYQAKEECDFPTAKKALAICAGIAFDDKTGKEYQTLKVDELLFLGFNRASMQKIYDEDRELYKEVVLARCDKLISIFEEAIKAYKSKKASGADELYEICEVEGVLKEEVLLQLNANFVMKLNKVRSIKDKVIHA
jgi:hypothetical protein